MYILYIAEQLFPVLTSQSNSVKLSYRRSFVIVFVLYASHILSAWVSANTYMYLSSSVVSISLLPAFKALFIYVDVFSVIFTGR